MLKVCPNILEQKNKKIGQCFPLSTVFQLKSVCARINWLVAVYSGISQFVQIELFWAKWV